MRQDTFAKSGGDRAARQVVCDGVGPASLVAHAPKLGDGHRIATANGASGSRRRPATSQPAVVAAGL